MALMHGEFVSSDESQTEEIARRLAKDLTPGSLVLLTGDLGAGKTCFVRGLAAGLGADPGEVASPTFALVHEYGPEGKPPVLAHADFYRLSEAESRRTLAELGLEDLMQSGAVLAIEWPAPPYDSLPAWRVEIAALEGSRRLIRITPRD